MRIEMEGLHDPEEEKKASVLNPEQPHESDLTRKERRLLEKKIKGMGLNKKLEYFWMYYKWVPAVILALILTVKFGMDWYHNAQMESVLAISAVNANVTEGEALSAEIKEFLGYDDEYSKVDIATNLTVDVNSSEFDYNAQVAYVTMVQTMSIDVLLFPERIYENANSGGQMFTDLSTLLDEETVQALGDQLKGDYIALESATELAEDFTLYYEPICLAVPATAKNPENAAKWIASVVAEQ